MPSKPLRFIRLLCSETDRNDSGDKGSKQGLHPLFLHGTLLSVRKKLGFVSTSLLILIEHISAMLFSQIMTHFRFHLLIHMYPTPCIPLKTTLLVTSSDRPS